MGAVGYLGGDPTKVSKAGDTMTGALVLDADPTAPLQAATKEYVEAYVQEFVTGGTGHFAAQGVVSTPAMVWTVTHNLGYLPAAIWCEDTQGNVLLSSQITWSDENTLTITWSQLEAGTWKVS